jgi:DNA-binding NarL/FixJ family response regulator
MTGALAPIQVMIVDDHPLVRSAIKEALNAPDIAVVAEAGTAADVLAMAPSIRPDVLLLDLGLPDVSGREVVRELSGRLPDTKIVILSVSKAKRDVVETMEDGARGYLTKDVAGDALLAAVRGLRRGELAMDRRMAARLIDHLVQTGHRRRPQERTGFGQLTPRQREVLRLVADGLTDRGIAAALRVSPRTVESHVSAILHKLGVATRQQALRRYLEAT